MIDLTVVIPAYNEEKRIKPTLNKIGRYLSTSKISSEVIVVVNNSTDKTLDIVKEISVRYPFIKALHIKGFTGKGGAISKGVKLGKGMYIAYQDADGSSDIKDVVKGYKLLVKNSNLDIVMGSRYLPDSNISGNLPLSRFILSRFFNITVRALYGLKYVDTQCAVKVMKRKVAKNLLSILVANKWTVDVNILIDGIFNGYSILEFPINWIYKDGSKLNVKSALLEVFKELLSLKIYQMNKYIKNFGLKIQSALSFQD